METLRPPARLPHDTAACVGAFDGMHLGHRALLEHGLARASRVAVVTFEPRPAELLAPTRAPARLQSPAQRARICAAMGVDSLALLTFDHDLASLAPRAFVDDVLVGGLGPSIVVVGPDFRFGRDRAGGPVELERQLAAHRVPLLVIPEQRVDVPAGGSEKVGSTGIRAHVRAGEMEAAARLLGRWYSLAGRVGAGRGRGRALGFPTANVDTFDNLPPREGVYAVWLTAAPDSTPAVRWPAVANLGTNPTFEGEVESPRLEVHALDRDLRESLEGGAVEVHFVARLRDERRFDGPTELTAAIAADADQARRLLDDSSRLRCEPPRLPRAAREGCVDA